MPTHRSSTERATQASAPFNPATRLIKRQYGSLRCASFKPPRNLASHRRILTPAEQARGPGLGVELGMLPGVEEVYLSPDEGAAYMKIDKSVFRPGEG